MKKSLAAFCLGAGLCLSALAQDDDMAVNAPSGDASAEELSLMDQPLDGSSPEAFQAGLDRLEEAGLESEYRAVMSSISFLLFYDLEVERDKAKLYAKLDGKSPTQIIEDVKNRRFR